VRAQGRQPRNESKGRLWLFVGLAVFLHLAGARWVLPLLLGSSQPSPTPKSRVRLVTIDGNVVRPYRPRDDRLAARTQTSQPAQRAEDERREPEKLQGQVVDLPPTPGATPPEDAHFLSEYNTRTERETKSRFQTKDYASAQNERTAKNHPREAAAPEIGPESSQESSTEKQRSSSELALELPGFKRRDRLALAFDPKTGRFRNQTKREAVPGNANRLKLSLGNSQEDQGQQGAAPKRALTIEDLVPTVAQLARIPGAPPNDHLDGVAEGDGTFLNSREFKYASFFNRVKRAVSEHWNPMIGDGRGGSARNTYGGRAWVTVVNVTLDQQGSIKDIEVARSSGMASMDREALSAFRGAEPFPNPPKGLISPEGLLTFAFGFHVELASHGGLGLPF
jgi:TonB family protein